MLGGLIGGIQRLSGGGGFSGGHGGREVDQPAGGDGEAADRLQGGGVFLRYVARLDQSRKFY